MSDITLLYFGVGILFILASASIIFNVIMVDKMRELRSELSYDIINESALMDEKIMDTIEWSDETKWKMQYICNQIDAIEKRLDDIENDTQLDIDDLDSRIDKLSKENSLAIYYENYKNSFIDLNDQIDGIEKRLDDIGSELTFTQSDIVDLREQIEGIKAYQREQDSTISYMQEHMEVKNNG